MDTLVTQKTREKAFLVAVSAKGKTDEWPTEDCIEELAQLANTAGAEVVGTMIQKLPSPVKMHYLGKGKLDELLALKNSVNYDMVIADDELSPQQQSNLEEFLNVKVIDRVALILDIFAQRARTREGKLQVELAQNQYLIHHLAGRWRHLERLGGGIGTRGPGETQMESDRRLIQRKTQKLKQQMEDVKKQRRLYREHRQKSGVPVVALVGYTNSGKSTLLNALSQANVLAEDRLFATLDPTTRRLVLPDKSRILMTDTVGFIHKLPPMIASAFRATLEELADASILIHVVDITLRNSPEQYEVVEKILSDLDLSSKPRITALNKIDKMLASDRQWNEESAIDYLSAVTGKTEDNTVLISATRKWGFSGLLQLISKVLASLTSEGLKKGRSDSQK
jgi:GTP-binding protein HflX